MPALLPILVRLRISIYLCMRALRVQCQWVNGIKSYRNDIDLLSCICRANLQWRSEVNNEQQLFAIWLRMRRMNEPNIEK